MSNRLAKLTEADRIALEQKVLPEDFYRFVKAAWHVLEPAVPLIEGWHIEALCLHLEALSKGRIKRLAISIPPGHSKSLITSVFWNAWVWTWGPHKRFISTGASEQACERDNGKLRELVNSAWYQARWPMSFPSVDSVTRFVNDSTGFRHAKSFHSLTGVRANYLILDDVLTAEDGNSDTERAKVNRRFFESATSRLEMPDGDDGIVIIMQRIHEEDLIGEIKERQEKGQKLNFVFLTIPMEWEGDETKTAIGWKDPRTKFGDLICPSYRSRDYIESEKETMGAYAYSAQYQQDPVPRSNGLITREDFRTYRPGKLPADLNYYITSDHAQGVNSRGDYNVVRVWAIDAHRNHYLIDSFRERCDIHHAIGIKRENGKTVLLDKGALPFIKKYRPLAWFADLDPIIKSAEALIRSSMIETNAITRFEIISHMNRDKVSRATAFHALCKMGAIFMPDNHIGETAIAEHVAFPAGRHDDQVDADGLLPRMGGHAAVIVPADKAKPIDDYSGVDDDDGERSDAYDCF